MLLTAGIPTFVITPFIFIRWGMGLYALDIPLTVALAGLLLGVSLWLTYHGRWRFGGYMLLATVFALAINTNYLQGAGTTALPHYASVLVLAAMLHGIRVQLAILGLCLGSYVGISWAHIQGHVPN